MARLWPGGTTTAYLTIPASSVWAYSTNICALMIVRASSLVSSNVLLSLGNDAGHRGWVIKEIGSGILELLNHFVSTMDATSTTALIATEWLAYQVSWGGLGAASFKRYRYSNSTLATENISGTDSPAAPLAADADNHIGQYLTVSSAPDSWSGDIDRVLIGQGTTPGDAAFTAWARAGTIPPTLTVKGYWILSPAGTSVSPEDDLGPNNLDVTVTGTTASTAFTLPDAALAINVGDAAAITELKYTQA